MARVDAVARVALMSLGICAQSLNISESELGKSSKKAIQALSKVSDAFIRDLRSDTSSSTFVPTSTSAPPTPYVQDIVAIINQTAKDVLSSVKGALDARGWSGREELHQELVNKTVEKLSNYTSSHVFNALAFLPDDRDDRQCRRFPEDRVVDVGYENLKYFVLYANSSRNETADEAWEKLKDNKDARDAVLEHVFAKSQKQKRDDLCGRLDTALENHGIVGFGGFAAVRCGYEFVWYELGYTYFYAAYSSTKYHWEMEGSDYDATCGQIFFFP